MKFKTGDLVQYRYRYYGKILAINEFSNFENIWKKTYEDRFQKRLNVSGGEYTICEYTSMDYKDPINIANFDSSLSSELPEALRIFGGLYSSFAYSSEDVLRIINLSTLPFNEHISIQEIAKVKKPILVILDSQKWPKNLKIETNSITVCKLQMIAPNGEEKIVYACEHWLEDWQEHNYATVFQKSTKDFITRMKEKFKK